MTAVLPGTAAAGAPLVQEWADGASWDAFVDRARDGTLGHRWAWLTAVGRSYGHPTTALAATRQGELCGVLPLVHVRSRLFGPRLVSLPYVDTAGLCTDHGDGGLDAALLEAATGLARRAGGQPLELRQRSERALALPVSLHKVTMMMDLTDGESTVWKRVRPNRRSQVRKATRNGLTVEATDARGLDAFFSVLATNMRDLGSPVHRRAFFAEVLAAFGADAELLLVRSGGVPVGAGLLLVDGATATLPFSSGLRSSFSLGTNQLLYWEAVRQAMRRGCGTLDLGRSSPGSGTFEAKREWGAEPVQLHWYSHPGPGQGGELSRPMRWATRAWQHLPVPLATAAGQAVRGGLPQ